MSDSTTAVIEMVLSEVRGLRGEVQMVLRSLATAEADLRHGESHMSRLDQSCKDIHLRMDATEERVAGCMTIEACERKVGACAAARAERKGDANRGIDRRMVLWALWIAAVAAFASLVQAFGPPLFHAIRAAMGGE